jgi:hypothetical protein
MGQRARRVIISDVAKLVNEAKRTIGTVLDSEGKSTTVSNRDVSKPYTFAISGGA